MIDNTPLSLNDYLPLLEKLQLMKKMQRINDNPDKFKIMKIVSLHGILNALMSVHKGFKVAFMNSNENRVKFLGKGHVKVKIQSDESDNAELGTVIDKGNPVYESLNFPYWIEWEGCGMNIPDNTYVAFNSQKSWPSIYIKNKKSTSTTLEVSIYERAWNIDMYSSDPSKVSVNTRTHATEGGLPGMTIINKTNSEYDEFNHVEVVIREKLAEFDIVIEIPLIAPFMDVLTEVRFGKDDDSDDNIIMTACCTIVI